MAAASVSAASESQFSVSSVFFGFRVGRDGSPGCLTFLVALDLASAALRGRRVPPGRLHLPSGAALPASPPTLSSLASPPALWSAVPAGPVRSGLCKPSRVVT